MSLKEVTPRAWAKFAIWALLYTAWVIWLGNFWWLFGLIVVFDLYVTKKVNWTFWKKEYKEGEKPNALLDWLDAIIFAVIVVTFVNIFFFQAFKIPSPSMERSLYTGDHLFVSKLTYGPRVPQTPLTIPFTHNVAFGGESYSTLIQNDYRRLKGFRSIRRNDIVVFGFPNGDTVLTKDPSADYYALCRFYGREQVIRSFGPVIVRPTDKKDHYVKRCVAVAGDSLSVIDGFVYINGVRQETMPGMQMDYTVRTNGEKINPKTLRSMGIESEEAVFDQNLPGYPVITLTGEMVDQLKSNSAVQSVEAYLQRPSEEGDEEIFPFNCNGWTRDFFGPVWVPQKGVTVKLDADMLPFYERIIRDYEHNTLKVDAEGGIFVNGERVDTYTFKQDYYFMMGDNRHNSLDSRYWGFVPEDHVVGKPALIWLSTVNGKRFPQNIRWRRFLKFL